jgi:hypothetical protein
MFAESGNYYEKHQNSNDNNYHNLSIASATTNPDQLFDLFSYISTPTTLNNNSNANEDNSQQKINDDIKAYFAEDLVKSPNVLSYWSSKATIYPILTKMVKDILSVPASSAPIERIFSISSFLMRPHRSSLNDRNLQNLMILKANKKWL